MSEGWVITSGGFTWLEMRAAGERAVLAVIDLLRSLDRDDGAKPVPNMDWTVAETAVHLVTILNRGLSDGRRSETARGLDDLNRLCIDEIAERDVAAIADQMASTWESFSGLTELVTGDEPFPLHAGLGSNIKTALSYGLWDFLLHGFDIARATGRPWTIPPGDAALDLLAVLPPLVPWLRDDVRTGPSKELTFTFAEIEHAITVAVGGGRYDVTLGDSASAPVLDAVETLLAISKRRESSHPIVRELSSWFDPT